MEASVNRIELLGRTGNQPTLRQHAPSGTPLTQFSLYTTRFGATPPTSSVKPLSATP